MLNVSSNLLTLLDLYIEFRQTMEAVIDEWDYRQLFEALVYYREHKERRISGLGYEIKPLYHLLIAALVEQIRVKDPEWLGIVPAADANIPDGEGQRAGAADVARA